MLFSFFFSTLSIIFYKNEEKNDDISRKSVVLVFFLPLKVNIWNPLSKFIEQYHCLSVLFLLVPTIFHYINFHNSVLCSPPQNAPPPPWNVPQTFIQVAHHKKLCIYILQIEKVSCRLAWQNWYSYDFVSVIIGLIVRRLKHSNIEASSNLVPSL